MPKRKPPWMQNLPPTPTVTHTYGMFVWRGDGLYHHSTPLRTYKRQHAAQAYADKLNEISMDHVVRRIT